LGEEGAVFGEDVDMGGLAAEVIGAEGVYGNEDDGGGGRG